jgi:anion-transporting  ArsA/GET3 family ATPase
VDPKAFFTTSRVLIVAGKGGVGKTTVTAVLARAAESLGLTVRVVAVDEDSPLGGLLGLPAPLDTKVVTVSPSVTAQLVTPMQALDDYLRDHGLRGVTRQLSRTGVLDVVSAAAPGIDDILVLAKIKQLDRQKVADVILVDAPAAGHAIAFLRAPEALREIISVGPVNTQAVEAGELLADPTRCRVLLVTLAEETPVNEAIETAFALEEDIGVSLAPLVVNALYPPIPGLIATAPALARAAAPRRASASANVAAALAAAAAFRLHRVEAQQEQQERLAAALPLPQISLPFVFDATLTAAAVEGQLVETFLAELAAR